MNKFYEVRVNFLNAEDKIFSKHYGYFKHYDKAVAHGKYLHEECFSDYEVANNDLHEEYFLSIDIKVLHFAD